MPDYNEIWGLVSAVFCRNSEVEPPDSVVCAMSDAPGSAFEQVAKDALQRLAFRYHGVLFSNLYVPYANSEGLAQIDHVLLLADRLVVVECKDYKGVINCDVVPSRSGRPHWQQRTENEIVYYFYSPVVQNISHIRAISDAIGVSSRKCFSLIVFSERAQLVNAPKPTDSLSVLTLPELENLDLQPSPARMFTTYKYNYILKTLESFLTVTPEDLARHEEYVRKRSSEGLPKAPPTVCPLCGSVLVTRYGHSRFLGCSMYPLCEYTFSLDDASN